MPPATITNIPTPQTIVEFAQLFHDEAACQNYLLSLRFPDGFVCPECQSTAFYWHRKRRLVICSNKHQLAITAGTVMQDTRTPLLTWFYGAFLATTLTPGLSAVQFQKQLGLKRYETAFQILHKLRSAMVNPEREGLHGTVEVDETFVGGLAKHGVGGRSTATKTLVVGAVEVIRYEETRSGFRAGRLRLKAIEDGSAETLNEFFEDHVKPGSIVKTDGWAGYADIGENYVHERTVEGDAENAHVLFPLIHLEFSNLKTWLNGTHHGRVERQHLQAYLNEFCFRHNRRFWRFSAFQAALRLGVHTEGQTYAQLYRTTRTGRDEFGRRIHLAGLDVDGSKMPPMSAE